MVQSHLFMPNIYEGFVYVGLLLSAFAKLLEETVSFAFFDPSSIFPQGVSRLQLEGFSLLLMSEIFLNT